MSIDRIGQGYDLHRLGPGGRLILAGIQIPSDKGLIGHSDADVLFHAVIDALLGAAGLPDIGQQFPDTDPAYKGIDSGQLLQRTLALINEQGYTPVNVDATILAERPKLQDYKRKMRENLAKLLHLEVNAVNIKAKTNEGLGEIGCGQAIACQAVAALRRNS